MARRARDTVVPYTVETSKDDRRAPTLRAKEAQLEPRWRVGRKLGRTLYVDGVCVGMVDTTTLAKAIVHTMNRDLKRMLDEARAEERAAIRKWLIIQSGDYAPLCAALRDGAHFRILKPRSVRPKT
jgi:hypothetical protein